MIVTHPAALARVAAIATVSLGALAEAPEASAQERLIGEIFIVGETFCPRDSADLNGQILSVNEFTALFSLLGNRFGGDGRTTFALPDLRGRTPMGEGSGPGLPPATLAARGGAETVTLDSAQ
ncbi:MAG: tail fiber protein, partial [Pseudomonadota bacterium]